MSKWVQDMLAGRPFIITLDDEWTNAPPPKVEKVLMTVAGEFPVTEAPEIEKLWDESPKRKNGQPDRRHKIGRDYWAAFNVFEAKKVAELYSGNPPAEYVNRGEWR